MIGIVQLAQGDGDGVNGLVFVGYLLGTLLFVPAAAWWALGERSRAGTAALIVVGLVVPVLILRLQQIWTPPVPDAAGARADQRRPRPGADPRLRGLRAVRDRTLDGAAGPEGGRGAAGLRALGASRPPSTSWRRTAWRSPARAPPRWPGSPCTVELVGVLVVGTLSVVEPSWFPDDTVWSDFGSGYGWVPLVLPFLGLAWLFRTTRPRAARGQRNADSPGERLTDHQLVHLGGALVGQHRLEVVGVPHERVLQRDPGRAEDRPALARDRQRLAGAVQLADADRLGPAAGPRP